MKSKTVGINLTKVGTFMYVAKNLSIFLGTQLRPDCFLSIRFSLSLFSYSHVAGAVFGKHFAKQGGL